MKNKKIIMALILCLTFFGFLNKADAASGRFDIHYYEEPGYTSRKPTYTKAMGYLSSMGYSVYGYDYLDAIQTIEKMKTAAGFVIHMHGGPGRQYMKNNTLLCGKKGDATCRDINFLPRGSFQKMKIAIYYGCETGITTSSYGDICYETVNKGATAAVAWKVVTKIDEVNEWNRLFFEKTTNDTIVEGYRHADYWVRANIGNTAGDRMQNNRTERGNIYAKIN